MLLSIQLMLSIDKASITRALKTYTTWVCAHARLILLCAGIIGILAGYYTTQHLGIHSKTEDMFDPMLPFRQDRETYNQHFPQLDYNFIVVIDGPSPEATEQATLSLIQIFNERDDLFQSTYAPREDPFLQRHQLLYLNTNDLQALADQLVDAQAMMGTISQSPHLGGLCTLLDQAYTHGAEDPALTALIDAANHTLNTTFQGQPSPLSWQNLMMGDSTPDPQHLRRFIHVKPQLDFNAILPAEAAIVAARELAKDQETTWGVTVRLTGEMALAYDEMQSVSEGTTRVSLLTFLLVTLTLWVGLRSWRLIFAALITLLLGLICTAAFAAWAVGNLNMISIAFAVLYIGLGIDYGIHLCLGYREHLTRGSSPYQALVNSASYLGPSLLLCAASTTLGFFAFVPTDFSGVSELGLIAGTGMLISLIVSLTLLPALLHTLPLKASHKYTHVSPNSAQASTTRLSWLARRKTWVRLSALLLALISIPFLLHVPFDYNPLNLRDPASESVSTLRDLVDDDTLTPWTISLLSKDTKPQRIAQLQALEPVSKVFSIHTFIPDNQDKKLDLIDELDLLLDLRKGNDPAILDPLASTDAQVRAIRNFHQTLSTQPRAPNSSADRLHEHLTTLISMLPAGDLPAQAGILDTFNRPLFQYWPITQNYLHNALQASFVSLETMPDSIREHWISASGQYRIEVLPAPGIHTLQDLRPFAQAVSAIEPRATGDLIVTLHSGDTVVKAFQQAFTYALIAIALLLSLCLRNIQAVVLTLFPLLLAGLMTAAATVLGDIPFNYANIIALPLLLGLGIDNGIHLVQQSRQPDTSPQRSTPRAIFFSTLTTLIILPAFLKKQ